MRTGVCLVPDPVTFPLSFIAMTFWEVKNSSRRRRLEGGAEMHPGNGRKETSTCALGGGKVRSQAAAGEWFLLFASG